jgi:TrmH family RNA methyltransferase
MQYTKTLSNNLKKNVGKLLTKQGRYKSRQFIAEGFLINQELLNCESNSPEFVIISKQCDDETLILSKKFAAKGIDVFEAEQNDFEKLCDAQTPQPILSILKMKDGIINKNENFIALDGIADPGNLGTIIRTADWFGFNNILLGKNCADQYNPKVIRSTMGSFFHCNILFDNDLAEFIPKNFENFEIFGATLEAKLDMEKCVPKDKFGIVIGSESHGISKNIRKIIDFEYRIGGSGRAESLNASIAAGITMYWFGHLIVNC